MRFILYLFLFITSFVSAQVTDNFSDGDFTASPPWNGDATEFIINTSKQLQLNNTIAGASYLSTASPGSSLNNIQWTFYIKESFAPSSSNYGRVYLVSDQANLEGSLNGYYLQFGETGSLDAVELFCQTGLTSTSVCRGINGEIAASFAVGVKVTRDASGNWSLFVDPAGGTAYTLEASGTDITYTATSFFGVATVYTVSDATKFYFDDFYDGPIIIDAIPPAIVSSTVVSSTQVDILFNENVDMVTSQTLTNYSADNGLGNPIAAMRDTSDKSLVHLTFGISFTGGLLNTLTIINVQDLSSNPIISATTTFNYHSVQEFDIVINELMVDPDPQLSGTNIPDYEYAELYNRTAFPVNLNNWQFITGTTTKILPNVIIPADSFIVITSSAASVLYAPGTNIAAVSSVSLTNTGQTVTLRSPQGTTISTVSYTDAWYQDAAKKDGGWSLEQIDPSNPCAGMSNWKASANINGGTPGKRNSIFASNPDHTPPQVLRVSIIAADTIQLYYSEPIDSATMSTPSIYTIDNSIGIPVNVKPMAPDFKSVRLTLGDSLSVGVIYTILVNNAITDCVGNVLGADNTTRFAIPQQALPNDIVINEILYDPNAGGVDFVEVYNRSNKIIDLKTITLSQFDTINNVIISPETITTDGYLVFPKDYILLSKSGNTVKSQYNTTNPEGFADMSNLPSMNTSGGTICLSTPADIIDNFKYYPDMQFGLLNVTKGVSLERVNFDRPTQDRTNWHSAAEAVGFATPGYRNSQYNEAGETDNAIEITPELFSPDEDGVNDIVNINYHFDSPGYVANVTIYDSNGRIVKLLKRNELLGTKGTFSWDGLSDEREKARIGIYIVYFEVFDLSGKVRHYKKTCVLAGKL